MSLIVSISPDLEQKLRLEAAHKGPDVADYARDLLEQHFSAPREPDRATLDLLAKWDAEDATDDPAELQKRQQDWEELKQSLNENHTSKRRLFP